ncbi:MAG: hypothetical protein RL186_1080 [Pseudomonadota bacterium]
MACRVVQPLQNGLSCGRGQHGACADEQIFLGLVTGLVAQQFLRTGLCMFADGVANDLARDHQNLSIGALAPDQHMGMGLVGVIMIDGDPMEVGLFQVLGDI